MIRALPLTLLLVTPAVAQPLDGPGFDAYVNGTTFSFERPDGTPFGKERYSNDQGVTWSGAPGQCQVGRWFARDGKICFAYQGEPQERCWTVTLTDRGMRAESETGTVLYETPERPDPLICLDPDLTS